MKPAARYLAEQILFGELDYTATVTDPKWSKYKDEIDAYLRQHHFVFPEA